MENIVFNPENYKKQYLEHLNECFKGWGSDTEYNWVFNRKVGEHNSDILIIQNKEDGVIAGSAVSYRQLSDGERNVPIGIMTGSWTLPAARRKGCFGKMIDSSKNLCAEKNTPFLTAFVTETNPSRKGLETAGSYMVPSYNLFSPTTRFAEETGEGDVVKRNKDEQLIQEVYNRMRKTQEGFLNFSYTKEEFAAQYISRIKETTVLSIGNDFAILEDGANEMKILLMTYENTKALKVNMKLLTNWCLEHKEKKAFLFTTREEAYKACSKIDFENAPGFFTVLKTAETTKISDSLFKNLNINMADKM